MRGHFLLAVLYIYMIVKHKPNDAAKLRDARRAAWTAMSLAAARSRPRTRCKVSLGWTSGAKHGRRTRLQIGWEQLKHGHVRSTLILESFDLPG